jgi:hypothetical protein
MARPSRATALRPFIAELVSLERDVTRLERELLQTQRDLRAHVAAIAYLKHGSWQQAARVAGGYRDGSSCRSAVERRTDLYDEDGARLAKHREHRVGRLARLPEAKESMGRAPADSRCAVEGCTAARLRDGTLCAGHTRQLRG